jgi:DNA-binding response OmpR family regulator
MKKILIADEVSYCRQLFSFALQKHGYEVITAEDGVAVIDALKREKPDLVIMESRLPKIDGLAVLRVMRSSGDFKHIPVFMLTALENRQQIMLAVQIGVQEYILKSQFDLATLLARIRKCIGSASGLVSRPAIEEVWEDVSEPLTGSVEVPGEMDAGAVGWQRGQ